MRTFLNWKIIAIILMAVALGYIDLPSKYHDFPFAPNYLKRAKVHLGLDLQGGIQLDYKIDLRKVHPEDRRQILEGVREVINRRVNALGVSEPNIFLSEIAEEQHIIVELAGIKDVEQAKKTVGKTIQLEFKELKEEGEDPDYETDIKKRANAVLQKITQTSANFPVIAQEEEFANSGKVLYEEVGFEAEEDIFDAKFAEALFEREAGEVTPLLENVILSFVPGQALDSPTFTPLAGYAIGRVLEKQEIKREEKKAREVSVSHLLVAYEGATRASAEVTRNKKEAKASAEEILQKIKSGETDFETAAKEFSDEPGAEENAGKLEIPVKERGVYAKPFTSSALKLQNEGQLSEVTETEFGFHIIRADSIAPESVITHTEPQVRYEYVFFSVVPDPWKVTELTGEHFRRADVQFDNLYQPLVAIEFNKEGAALFEQITERNISKPIAIFVGGNLISAPRVNQKIGGGQAVITGNFTAKEAQDLARDLNTGAIPAPIILTGQYAIGASLGKAALETSLKAGLLGIAIVILFMIAYYRVPGLIASIALLIYSVLLIFLFKASLPLGIALAISLLIFLTVVYQILQSQEDAFEKLVGFVLAIFVLFFLTFLMSNPVVLTLAGVAGIILSIGMAVDANILIFERTREELKLGRPISAAVEVGFERAWSSIRDSNFSSLITTAILFYFGTSIIKGFALTLAAGILISMFTAITVTRNLLMSVVRTKLNRHTGLFVTLKSGERKIYDFVGKSKIWFSVSGLIVAVSLVSLLASGLKLGIDFTGGSLMDLQFTQTVSAAEIGQTIGDSVENASVIPSEENRFMVRTKHINEETHEKIIQNLREKFGKVEEIRFTTVGPTIGETLKKRAVFALGLALLAIVLYIAFAFRKVPRKVSPWKFGLCAIIALVHDTIIPIGIFSIFKIEVDAFLITALLTIIGFSVHDTIVVFDRIREHLKTAGRDETFKDIANKALRETLSRSINTSVTTLFTLLMLLFFGSASIFYFILALVIGILIGTYSSIFIATPVLSIWQKKNPHGL